MLFVFRLNSEKKKPGLASYARLPWLLVLNNLGIMIAVNQGGQGFQAQETPPSNTGLNALNLDEPQLTVKIDWLQVSTLHGSVEDFKEMLSFLEEMFSDQITWYSDQPIYRGRRWETSGSSVRGIQVCFDPPTETCPGRGWVMLPGGLLSQVDAQTTHDVCCMLMAAWDAVARRLDIAVDDYSKPFDFHQIYEQAKDGHIAYVRKTSVAYHASTKSKTGEVGESVVLGSAQSDKRLTFYNKAVESDGQVDSHRVEVRLRDYKADQVFQHLAAWSPGDFQAEGPKYLASIVTGAVHFVDRTSCDHNLDRLPVLAWWAEFCQRCGGARLKLAAKKIVHSMERKINWFFSDVAPSLAMIKGVLSPSDFRDFKENLIDSGESRLSEKQRAQMRVFSFDWYENASYGDSIHSVVLT